MTIYAKDISRVCNAPLLNVEMSWGLITKELAALGVTSREALVAAAATITVETGVTVGGQNKTFLPIHELGGTARLNRLYDTRVDLGNTVDEDGDGAEYAGRGFIQLTGKRNYETYGAKLGLDLVGEPDLALRLDVAAKIFAQFFHDSGAAEAAEAGNLVLCRKRVNGGTNGLQDFLRLARALNLAWRG